MKIKGYNYVNHKIVGNRTYYIFRSKKDPHKTIIVHKGKKLKSIRKKARKMWRDFIKEKKLPVKKKDGISIARNR